MDFPERNLCDGVREKGRTKIGIILFLGDVGIKFLHGLTILGNHWWDWD